MSEIVAGSRALVIPKDPQEVGETPHENVVNPPKPGEVVAVELPVRARHRFGLLAKSPIVTTHRTLLITAVDDATLRPWTICGFLKRPALIRGRWRVKAFDYLNRGWRNFYADWRTPCKLQLGLWNPLTNEFVERIGEPYSQDAEGISELFDECRELMKEPPLPGDGVTMAIFAVV